MAISYTLKMQNLDVGRLLIRSAAEDTNLISPLDSLPPEIILCIIHHLPTLNAILFSLTKKTYFALVGKEFIGRLNRKSARQRRPLLRYLERDLPWYFYYCHNCKRIHKLEYEQGWCDSYIVDGGSRYGCVSDLQLNNRDVAIRYLAYLKKNGRLAYGATTSYFYERQWMKGWGYVDVQDGRKGAMCYRYRNWLRWTSTTDPWLMSPGLYSYMCRHINALGSRISPLGLIWKRNPRNPHQVLALKPWKTILNLHQSNPTEVEFEKLSDMPDHWIDFGIHTCRFCRIEVSVHFGLSEIKPIGKEIRKMDRYKYDLRYPPHGNISELFLPKKDQGKDGGLVAKFMDRMKEEKQQLLWCDTIVITKWKLGIKLDVDILDSTGHAFDHYHPAKSVPTNPAPIWKGLSAVKEYDPTPIVIPY